MKTPPLDIQLAVIEWVYRSSQHSRIDYATLRACALVCRGWTRPAQRLLFRRVPCKDINVPQLRHLTRQVMTLLVHTLRTRPDLAAYVRSIQVSLWSPLDNPADVDELALLELCTRVDGIFFKHQVGNDDYPALEERLRAIPLRPTFLEVFGAPSAISRIVNLWPSVRAIDCIEMRGGATPTPPPSAPASVQSLCVSVDNLGWIPAPENGVLALRGLELTHPRWPDTAWAQPLIATGILPHLRTLTLWDTSFPPPEVLAALSRLESLALSHPPMQDVALPRSLRHVGYHGWKAVSEIEVAFMVAAFRALPDLQLVTLTRRAGVALRESLAVMCNEYGAELVLYEGRECYRLPRHVDWI
ncbi:hypothetical protein FA95DRAFT_1604641 [Auriscalpium vulgare]|uniref:Uncharacterized protein n=1 Tax=Auriscalpium vulgare TaxID=40419 RepID=A0ACB8RYK6_9AGAM|nr:hypothetical protein FA95DRAFT_1604641 [Auriscalpium vulgare]